MHADKQDAKNTRFSFTQFIIVHEYQVGRPGISQPQLDNTLGASVFQTGSRLARDAVSKAGWRNTRDLNHTLTLKPNGCFLWAQKPPQLLIQDELADRRPTLKAWGEPLSQDEIIKLSELSEFEHDGFHINYSVSCNAVQKKPREIERANLDAALRPRKKRRLFSSSLHEVVAQPHFYSSAWNTTTLGQTVQVPGYKKTKSINVPPYGSDFTLSSNPLSAYTRTAWIIPVRGILPWSACTPAVVLDDGEGGAGKEGAWIQWTKAALIEFWAFLLDVRAAGKVGQVGISFHMATAREREGSLSTDAVNEQYSNSTHGISEPQVWNLPLSYADHIKIYHEANNAMSLRNVLDAWAYTPPPSEQKVRVLKGSRFVLVDERCRGILVS